MKVLVTSNSFGKYSQQPIQDLEAAGFEVILNPYHRMMNEQEFIEQLMPVDAVILSTEVITSAVLDACPNLKMISRYGVGLDNIDLKACEERGISVTVTAGANSNAVAEYAVTLMLAASKGLGYSVTSAKQGEWRKFNGMDLDGKTIGIVGLGAIGKHVVEHLAGFHPIILAYDVYYDEAFVAEHGVQKVSLDTLLEKSDVITLHMPAKAEGALIGEDEFARMKDHAILVNTARASLVDTAALLKALESGKLFAAALDVHEHEPKYDERLLAFDNVILTPHNGAITKEATDKTSSLAVHHLLQFFGKE